MENPVENSVFKFIASVYKKNDIPCVLVGGYALIANKVQRMTFDIDLIISEKNFAKIEEEIINKGYKTFNRQKAFVQFSSKEGAYQDIDFLITDERTINILIEEGSETIIAGERFIVPSPLHLVAMKLHSISNNKTRKSKDFSDIAQLFRLNNIDPEHEEIKGLFDKYGSREIYTDLCNEFKK